MAANAPDALKQEQLKREQAAFEEQREALLVEHSGKCVLFKDGHVVDFFDDHAQAYEAGLKRFGVHGIFLIAKVEPREPAEAISLAWDAGVMF